VEEEYLRQKKLYEQEAETRARDEEQRARNKKQKAENTQTLSDALAYRARFEAKRLAQEKEVVTRSNAEELKRWRVQAAGDEDTERPGEALGDKHAELCTWHECDKGVSGGPDVRRKGSKYCSRDCSNKNARWRHKKRKTTPQSA
jgi:hypothetical protein